MSPDEPEVPVRFVRATYFPPAGPYFQEGDEAVVPESVAQLLGDRGRVERTSPTEAEPAATVRP